MKNKIRNTEMEYIARANRCVDSSFLADGSGRLIGALVFYCTYVVGLFVFFFLFARPGSLFYTKTLFSLHDGTLLSSL